MLSILFLKIIPNKKRVVIYISIDLVNNLSKKTPLEERIDALADSFETIVDLMIEHSQTIDRKVDVLNARVIELEEKVKNLTVAKESPLKENISSATKPPLINSTKIMSTHPTNSRQELISELKKMFELREKGQKK